jgi:hypothetical protein
MTREAAIRLRGAHGKPRVACLPQGEIRDESPGGRLAGILFKLSPLMMDGAEHSVLRDRLDFSLAEIR